MKQYALEIVRQKWRHLSIILFLLLLNITSTIIVSSYQFPSLAELQTKWNALRLQASHTGKVDAASLYQQAAVDLEMVAEFHRVEQVDGVVVDLAVLAGGGDEVDRAGVEVAAVY